MERAVAFTVENFISNWNGDFPNQPLTAADISKPHAVMKALTLVFERLGIDLDAVLSVSPEENLNENMTYYRDLLPVINVTRVINRLVSVMPQVDANISVTHFLQPTAVTSHSILLLLFNLMVFNEERLRDIAPHEEELFAKTEQKKTLQDNKHKLLEMLNRQAEEKGKRAERLEKLDYEIKQFEEELKQENDANNIEKQELEAVCKDNHQKEILLDQKNTHEDALMAEIASRKALKVYDADEIKALAEQAAINIQEAEEKLNSLRATLMQKEKSLKNLQTIKPSLDTANNLLHEIMKLSDNLKYFECGDLDTESKEGELDVFNTELSELQVQLNELHTTRAEVANKRQESCTKREHEKTLAQCTLREAEEKDRKYLEIYKRAIQRIEEIKEQTLKYEEEKSAGLEEVNNFKITFCSELKSIEDMLMNKVIETYNRVETKLRGRDI